LVQLCTTSTFTSKIMSRIIHLDQVQMYFTGLMGDPQVLVIDGTELEASIEMIMAEKVHENKPKIVISCGSDTELTQVNLSENSAGDYDEEDDDD